MDCMSLHVTDMQRRH